MGRVLIRIAAICAVIIGVGLFLVVVTLGDCSAFGGRCPRPAGTATGDDVLGMSAVGGALFGAGATFAARPAWRSTWIAMLTGAAAAGVFAAMGHSITSA